MKHKIKRIFDLIFSSVTLIILTPLLALIYIVIRIKLGAPVIFKQKRPGKNGNIFTLYKFRSMTNHKNKNGELLSDAERLTEFGRFLRKTSLDELPELFNIFKGDMSFVGPRPLLTQYLPRYNAKQARRHEVKPGLTGWAQINGRNAISWEEKFEFDVWYVDYWTLSLDLKILCITAWKVLKKDGISADGESTMSVFMGSKED